MPRLRGAAAAAHKAKVAREGEEEARPGHAATKQPAPASKSKAASKKRSEVRAGVHSRVRGVLRRGVAQPIGLLCLLADALTLHTRVAAPCGGERGGGGGGGDGE